MMLDSDPGGWLVLPARVPCPNVTPDGLHFGDDEYDEGLCPWACSLGTVPNPALRQPCPECDGKGYYCVGGGTLPCSSCDSDGTVPPGWVQWAVPVVNSRVITQ